jgi:hypothetical protein
MIKYEYYENKNCYINFNCVKGYEYELYVKKKLRDYYDIAEIYMWEEVPDDLLIVSGIIQSDDLDIIKGKYRRNKYKRNSNILLDTGIDIVFTTTDNHIYLVQCKAYNSIISQKHLSGFFRILLDTYIIDKNKDIIRGLIVHTSEISDIIKESYCYKEKIISELYLPFHLTASLTSRKRIIFSKKYNSFNKFNKLNNLNILNIIYMLNINGIILYIIYILNLYLNK